MTLVGTRPELIKMSRVIAKLDVYFEHTLVHSGQNYDYELNQIFFDDLEIRKPDFFLNISRESAVKSIADVIVSIDALFEQIKPDAFLLYGDTNTCLAVIAAKRRKIPVFHMEAGNRCFDQRVPEELNRKVVDHLSDINLVLTEHARRYLIAEGIRQETIMKTGSHMQEILNYYQYQIDASTILAHLHLEKKRYFLISAHREENVDVFENLHALMRSLNALAEKYQFPLYVSTHPRTCKRLEENALMASIHPLIHFVKPLGFFDYIQLQRNAFCVLSDSGTLTEEASLLHFSAVMLRNAHERPEGMDVGTLIMSGLQRDNVLDAVRIVTAQRDDEYLHVPAVHDYQVDAVSSQIARIIMSYIPYIRQNVWREFSPTHDEQKREICDLII